MEIKFQTVGLFKQKFNQLILRVLFIEEKSKKSCPPFKEDF